MLLMITVEVMAFNRDRRIIETKYSNICEVLGSSYKHRSTNLISESWCCPV